MYRRAVRRLIFCIVSILAACAAAYADDGLTYLESAGRYGDLAKSVEARLARGEPADSSLLGPLCMAYGKLKQFDKLFDCVAKLEARIAAGDRTIKGDYFIPTSMQAEPVPGMLLAEAYMDLGDYARSIREGERALAAVTEQSAASSIWPSIKFRLVILPDLTIAAALGGDKAQAEKYLARLDDVSIGFVGSAMSKPIKENGLARAYMALGEYAKASEHLGSRGFAGIATALADITNPFAYRGDSIATLSELPRLFMLAKAELELKHLDEAHEAFAALFANKRLPDLGDIYWLALAERARLDLLEGRPNDSIEDLRHAVDVIETQRTSINTDASKIGFSGNTQDVYRRLIAGLFEAGRMPEAFDYVERSKSRALVDMLASKKDFSVAAADGTKVRELLARAEQSEAADRSKAYTAAPPPDEGAPRSTRSGQRNLAVATALQEVAQQAPELASLVSVSSTPLAEIEQRIPADEALVEYYYDDKSLFAFVLTSKDLQAVRLEAGGLEADVRELRAAIEQPGSEAYLDPAQRLYARLIRPIEAVAGKAKLVVVAHGVLHYLPFAALHDGNRFLVEKVSLRLLPSASVLKYLRAGGAAKSGGILALGNPDLGDPRYDLRFAQDEALAVVKTVPQSRALVRAEATESALRQYAAGFRYLHFATHGEFDPEAPLQSALLLAKEGTSDGLLTVGKLYSMRLDADLVTLSACETGLGKIVSGDDVIGLTRGFLYAGASTIVASLWQVDDQATAALMTSFYDDLKSMDKREALRQAQLATKAKFPHPFFWAAFQLTGSAI